MALRGPGSNQHGDKPAKARHRPPAPTSDAGLAAASLPFTAPRLRLTEDDREQIDKAVASREPFDISTPVRSALADNVSSRLLIIGGDRALVDPLDEDLAGVWRDGQTFQGKNAVMRPGEPSQCHRNVAVLAERGVGRPATGWALGNADDPTDGIWRPHSWLVDDNGRVVETTLGRQAYHGVVLDGAQAETFIFDNA